jgi:hypothetical protein
MPGRFRFSFPPRRHQADPWFRIGELDVTTTVLVSLICVATVFVWVANSSALLHLALIPHDVWHGQVWRLITWPFVSAPDPQFLWTVLRIAIFWWFARELEAQIGRVKFALLLALVVLGSGLVAAGLDVSMGGLRYVELAVFVLFVAEHPRVPFFFGIPGWIIGAVFVATEFLDLISNRAFRLAIVLLVSLALGLLGGRSMGLAADQEWIPAVAPRGPRRGSTGRRPKRGGKNTPVVVSGPWAPPSPPMPAADQAEMDRLLDKISAVGIDGLTADEKRRLKEVSERLKRERD